LRFSFFFFVNKLPAGRLSGDDRFQRRKNPPGGAGGTVVCPLAYSLQAFRLFRDIIL
jgi:hypothetical protein